MYWNTAAFRPSIITQGHYWPGPGTLLGGLDAVNTSATHSPALFGCGSYSILVPSTRECIDPTLNVSSVSDNPDNLNLYPNPVNDLSGEISISYQLAQDSYVQFKIIDCIGKEITILDNEHKPAGTYNEQLNVSNLAGGIYLFVANINGQVQTIKFIKL